MRLMNNPPNRPIEPTACALSTEHYFCTTSDLAHYELRTMNYELLKAELHFSCTIFAPNSISRCNQKKGEKNELFEPTSYFYLRSSAFIGGFTLLFPGAH